MADILIVEDEESINQLIKQNLMLSGHHCTQIFDGGCDYYGYYAARCKWAGTYERYGR